MIRYILNYPFYWRYVIIALDNGLSPLRRQAIIWNKDALIYRRKITKLIRDELRR